MRKAKTAAIIFGGVSTCLFGGLLGVYNTAPVVSSAAPEDDAQSIYNVQGKELANTAVFTSIGTTITKTSTEFTTANAVNTISAETTASTVSYDTYSTAVLTTSVPVTATAPNTTLPVYTDKVITADAMVNIIEGYTETENIENNDNAENDEEISENIVDFGMTAGNLSDCFIASDETTAENYSWDNFEEDSNETDNNDNQYYAPAFEYIVTSPVTTTAETTTETTATTTETYSYDDYYNDYYDYYSDYYDYYYSDYFHDDQYSEPETTAVATEITTETTATETTTTAAATESTTTATTETTVTETTTTTTAATTEATTATEITTTTEEVQADFTTETTETTATVENAQETYLPITDAEYILLCNAVANEAGSSWIGLYEKGNVVEVIMNRVNSPLYPNSIYDVITQPYQFTGSENYAYLSTYSQYVTEDVKNAVNLYFNEPSSFMQNYFGFYGDGFQNYFY